MLTNRSMPESTVIPVLVYEDVAEAVEWLSDAFGFSERIRIGSHRSQLSVGDGAVIVTERRVVAGPGSDQAVMRPPPRGVMSHAVMVRVEDVDAHYQKARRSGARIIEQPTDHPYGERQYAAEDLAGHRWSFSQSIADVAPEDWGGETLDS
jgi:uncharacterized glyoxalase superfamily protein PhnB